MKNSILPSSPCTPADTAPAVTTLRSVSRPDTLTAQRVEVGIMLNAMLDRATASDYLLRHAVHPGVIARVLSAAGPRRGSHDANGVRT